MTVFREFVWIGALNYSLFFMPGVYVEDLGEGDVLVHSLKNAIEMFNPTVIINLFKHGNFNAAVLDGMADTLARSLSK